MGETGRAGESGHWTVTPAAAMPLPLVLAGLARRLGHRRPQAGELGQFSEIVAGLPLTVPLFLSAVNCGFPSPADDYLDAPLDLNDLLVRNKPATFAVRIKGDSMQDVGLFPGDFAIIDRSLTVRSGCVVLAVIGNDFTIKRFIQGKDRAALRSENRAKAYADIEINEDSGFEVWGVVKHTIRMLG